MIGGGQSAAECFLDLLREQKTYGYELNWLARCSGFFPMEYSKLGLEHFSPDYIEHFYGLSSGERKAILASQSNWYKGISFSTIKDIYDCLYVRSGDQPGEVTLQARSELLRAERSGHGWTLAFRHVELQQPFAFETEAVVLGTGYKYAFPNCLNGIRHLVDFDQHQQPVIQRNYTLQTRLKCEGHIFVQNGEMHTHGMPLRIWGWVHTAMPPSSIVCWGGRTTSPQTKPCSRALELPSNGNAVPRFCLNA